MAAINSMIVEQVDYTAAYLNAMIDNRVIFMRQPTGFEIEGKLCLVVQALYTDQRLYCSLKFSNDSKVFQAKDIEKRRMMPRIDTVPRFVRQP
jgi:hypothetical protein